MRSPARPTHAAVIWPIAACLSALLGCVDVQRADVAVPEFGAPRADLAGFDAAEVDDGRPADVGASDRGPAADAARPDAAGPEAGVDAATVDAQPIDAQPTDAVLPDARPVDAAVDAQPVDAQPLDAQPVDAQPVVDAGPPVCVPAPEQCNGADDDCDDQIDEDFPQVGERCTEEIGACRLRGRVQCDPDGVELCLVEPGLTLNQREQLISGCGCNTAPVNGPRRYVACNGRNTWAEADAVCGWLGMSLWIIDDADEAESLRVSLQLLLNGGANGWWVGLTDAEVEGEFRWLDGRPVADGHGVWLEGEPNDFQMGEDCGLWYPQARGLNDGDCAMPSRFVCEPPSVE